MKRLIIGALISTVTIGTAFAECTYNFDATASQIAQIDSSVSRFPNVSNQKVGFNIKATNDKEAYAAFSSAYADNKIAGHGAGDINVPTTGIFAFEYKFKVPTSLLSGNEALAFFPLAASGNNSLGQFQRLGLIYTNNAASNPNKNEFRFFMNFVGSSYDLPVAVTASGYQTLGFYINASTKQVGIIFNGVNKGYVASFDTNFDQLGFTNAAAQYQFASNSSNLGKEVSIELITDHLKLQNTYPLGTKDICGNTI
ncbi:DUF4882 family protein [Acinetobacter sp. Ac_5812]|uniref:DUF4882 family protein n=1 Tax=Acinetobacter sp. Ac_5812 TaxID=1848937 RepID=UPI001C07F622|nr:hypothetical protein [Acinetobacter sp. Ac_5812]